MSKIATNQNTTNVAKQAQSRNIASKAKDLGLGNIKWQEPKPASNITKDGAGLLRGKAEKVVNSELFSIMPKVLSVFGVWFSLTALMQVGEKGLKETFRKMIAPLGIAVASLGFDYFIKPSLKEFVEVPAQTPKVNLEDLCWDKKHLDSFRRTLKLFMGDTTNYLGAKKATKELHGTNREGLLILAGPPGNGKTAIAYGIGNHAKKPIHSLKVSESSSSSAIEAAFKAAHKKGAILFIDEADAIIRSRSDKVTQAFLETFNRYQREKPVRVILATNSFSDMDSAIQSRSYVFNLANPSVELKTDIFNQKLQEQGLKSSAYKSLIENDNNALRDLLAKHDLSGRDIESIVQDLKVVAEMRINQLLLQRNLDSLNPEEVLGSDEVRIKIQDVEIALKDFVQMKKSAKKTSISSKSKELKDILSGAK